MAGEHVRAESGVAGTLVRARLQFIEERFGPGALEEAKRRIWPVIAATGGPRALLFRRRYPIEVCTALETLIDGLSPAQPMWRAVGAYEASLLLGIGGPYAATIRAEAMEIVRVVSQVTTLLSLIYDEPLPALRESSDRTCELSIVRPGLTAAGAEIQAGFLVEAIDMAGATQVLAEVRREPEAYCVLLQWVLRRAPRPATAGIAVFDESAAVECLERLRKVCLMMGFSHADLVAMATCVSGLVHNIVAYAGSGTVFVTDGEKDGRRCLRIVAEDCGPGIPHLDEVLRGERRSDGQGMGLAGIRDLADELHVSAPAGAGTTVEIVKFAKRRTTIPAPRRSGGGSS